MKKILLCFSQNLYSPWKIFLFLALTFGTGFVFLSLPFDVPDEPCHLARVMQLGQGTLIGERSSTFRTGAFVPKGSISAKWGAHQDNPLIDWNQPKGQFELCPVLVLYSPISYIPQMIGFRVAKALAVSRSWTLLRTVRASSLVAYAGLVALAIRLIPMGQWGLMVIGLLPMALFEAASSSADPMTYAFSFLFLALCLRGRPKELKGLVLLGMAVSLCKISYIALTLLTVIYAIRAFPKRRNDQWGTIGLVLVCSAVVSSAWMVLASTTYDGLSRWPDLIDPHLQLQYVLANKLKFIRFLIRFFWYYKITGFKQFVGRLGWLDIPLPNWLYYGYAILFIWLAVFQFRLSSYSLRRWERAWMMTTVCVGVFLTSLSLYLGWSVVGHDDDLLVQGRYLIPLSPVVLSALTITRGRIESTYRFLPKASQWMQWICIGWTILSLSVALQWLHRRQIGALLPILDIVQAGHR